MQPRTLRFSGLRDRPSSHAKDVASVTSRSLTKGYVLGLSLLALLILAGGWNITRLLEHQAQHVSVINVSGAQRMLSQRIAALAPDAANDALPDSEPARTEILVAAHRMAASHARLLLAIESPETGSPALRAHYLDHTVTGGQPLDREVRAFLDLVAQVLPSPAGLRAAAELHEIALYRLLPQLHQAVSLHEAAAGERIALVLRWHLLMVGLALLLLLIEAVFIFRPLVRRTAKLTGRLRREADTDSLTGLLNRRATQSALVAAMADGAPLAVIAIDLDHFKEANDAEGHEAGDTLLRIAAERISGHVRQGDIVGRVGGDEFVVFLAGVSDEAIALSAAHRLGVAMHQPVYYKGRTLRLGATFGVSLAPMDTENPESLLRAADEALMRAKRQARGSVGRACAEDTRRLARDAAVIRALKSTERGVLPGLTAHLQPIVNLANGELMAVEALARFQCEELGMVPPDELFGVAGRIGMAARISSQARDHALAAFVALRRDGLLPGRLAVNLSAAELLNPGVVEALEQQCESVGLDLGAITVEITEDALLDRVAATTLARLAALRGKGARLALDDFGTGTSGLAQLLRLPLDELKLDRTFTLNLGLDGRSERIIEGSVRLAASMGMRVVAEGIEDEAKARLLRDIGCEMGQGWLFARPMPAGVLRDWLVARQSKPGIVVPLHRVAG